MDRIYIIFCLAMIVFLALVASIIVSLRFGDSHVSQNMKKPRKRLYTGWHSWFIYISLSLVIGIWTVWGSLLILAVVWAMRQNPRHDAVFVVRDVEKNTARRLYAWLLLSPCVTLPLFLYLIYSLEASTINEGVLIALIPLIFHLPLLLGLTSKSTFVLRHMQQGILLVALRAGIASLVVNMGSYSDNGWLLFLLGNGSLWLFGSIWGWNQVYRGECWLMKQKGETLVTKAEELREALSPQTHLERSREFIGIYKADEAKKHALAAFHSGDREIKIEAVKLLSALREVEEF
jgi:hypothetical protein